MDTDRASAPPSPLDIEDAPARRASATWSLLDAWSTSTIAFAALLLACGGTPPTAEDAPRDDFIVEEDAPRAEPEPPAPAPSEPVALPGSRVTLALPAGAQRAARGLRWSVPDADVAVVVSDATVPRGEERRLAEEGLAVYGEEAEIQPTRVAGMDAVEMIIRRPDGHVRTVVLLGDGALARIAVHHPPGEALVAERVFESVRFDPEREIDPRATLDVHLDVEGLRVVPATNEQLLFRHTDAATPFPSAAPAIDVAWVPFREGRHPGDDRARGQLLGSRFAGLTLEGTEVRPVEGLAGFELVSVTERDEGRVALYGAYVEEAAGAFLVRASVDAARAPEWGDRFRALALALGGRP